MSARKGQDTARLIRALIVEDSPVVRAFLVHILESDPEIRVIGTAGDGEEAIAAVARERPDVVTMDIHMPKLDGVEATRRIMETHPTPIVIVSGSTDPHEVATTFGAVEAGALAVLPRPAGLGHADFDATARELIQTVKLMSEVKVVRRWSHARREALAAPPRRPAETPAAIDVIALGASTGGPPVLQTILSALPADFPAPVLVVQHMARGFAAGFAEWLDKTSELTVALARQGDVLRAGHVYVAPDGQHMRVERDGRIALAGDPPVNGLCPSVSYLFRSVAAVYGPRAVAGLLSGMGRDGAEELKLLRAAGAVTFAQDRETSAIHGMPGEAIRLDAAAMILPAGRIADALTTLVTRRR